MAKKGEFGNINIQISDIRAVTSKVSARVGNTYTDDPQIVAQLSEVMLAFARLQREAAPVAQNEPKVRRAVEAARKHLEAASNRGRVADKASLSRKLGKAKDAVMQVGALASASAATAPKIAAAAAKVGAMATSLRCFNRGYRSIILSVVMDEAC